MMANRNDEFDDAIDEGSEDDMFSQRERSERWQRPRVVSEFVRRAIENTVGSMQNTSTLSREALQYLMQQGDRGKREVVRIVAHEVGEFLKGVDLSSEVLKVLTNLTVEVNASVKFKTKDGAIHPEITHRTEVSPAKSDPPQPSASEPAPPSSPPEPPEGPKDSG
jgi:hypothetical protein